MKKIISITSIVVLFFSFLVVGKNCQAQGNEINFSAIGGNVVAGHINATNTGFQVSGTVSGIEGFDYAKLKASPSGLDLSGRLDPGDYSISQSNISLDDLKAKFPEGQNAISLFAYDDSDKLLDQFDINIIADYTLSNPVLGSAYTVSPGTSGGFLKIGDSIDFSMISNERLVIPNSKINDSELYWIEEASGGIYTYRSFFKVKEGGEDIKLPYELIATYQDLSGNMGEARLDLERQIDASLPEVNILSIKEGAVLKSNDVEVRFNSSETLGSYEVYLNGILKDIKNGEIMKDLADGDYILKIVGVDLAGNKVEKRVNFTIDTKVPEVSISSELQNTYNRGDEIILEGKTDPNSRVTVEVYSDVKYFETVADVDGNWRLTIDTSSLEGGWHDIYLKVIDPAGNTSRVLLGSFEIIISATEEAHVQEQDSVKLARAETLAIATDVAPVIYERVSPREEEKVAIEPRIISSSDTRNLGTNWSAWLILIGLVAVSFLVAFISYYGYSQAAVVAGKQRIKDNSFILPPEEPKPEEPEEHEKGDEATEDMKTAQEEKTVDNSVDKDDEEDVRVRW